MVLVDSDDEEERKLLLSESVPPSPVAAPRLAWTPATSSSAMTDCQDRDGDKEWGHQHPLLQYKQLKSDPRVIHFILRVKVIIQTKLLQGLNANEGHGLLAASSLSCGALCTWLIFI